MVRQIQIQIPPSVCYMYSWQNYVNFVSVYTQQAGLKLNIQKTKIMGSGPITSWQIDGETMETMTELIFLGSKITSGW